MKFLPLLITLVAALGSTGLAAEFRLISWDGDIGDLKYADGSRVVPLAAGETYLSPAYHHDGAGPLVLFREREKDGRTVREKVAELTWPAGWEQAIIILSATDAGRTAYTGYWIEDGLQARPLQTVCYQNLSAAPVGIRLGDREFVVPPRSSRTERVDTKVERLLLKAAAQTPSGWEIIASTSQSFRPGRRTLVLLRDGRPQPNGHKDLIDFLVFNDRPQAPEEPARQNVSK